MSPKAAPLQAFAPGKVILLGEHVVVYGYPAIAGALSWGVAAVGVPADRCVLEMPIDVPRIARQALQHAFERAAAVVDRPKIRVRLESQLPMSMGLGSSAAVAVSIARLLWLAAGKKPTLKDVLRTAREMEGEFHGQPSGIDHTTSAMGTLIEYRRRPSAPFGVAKPIASKRPLKLLVAIAGPRSPTRRTVAALRERHARWRKRYQKLFADIGALVREARGSIEAGDLEAVGDAMNVNHGLLAALGLSSAPLDAMVHRLRSLGALGAKLTGAGGDGGAVIGLFLEPEPIVAKLRRQGVECFGSQLAGPVSL